MARVDPTKKALSRLRDLNLSDESEQAELSKALFHKSNLVVSKAVDLICDYQLHNLTDHLEKAFSSWLQADPKGDPGCRAKTSIARTLCELQRDCQDLYLEGSKRIQLEKAFGGPVDTAAELRGICGLGLVRSHYDFVLERLADLLADQEPTTRALAAQALLEKGGLEAAALARLRLGTGEDEPTVILECLTALLVITKERGLQYCEKYLHSPNHPHWPVAILALGESRLEQACQRLIDLFEDTVTQESESQVLEAIALSRLEIGLDFLFQRVAERQSRGSQTAQELIRRFWGDSATLRRLDDLLC